MIRGRAGQSVGAQMISALNGAAFTGAVSVYVTGDAGTQVIGTVGAGAAVGEGNGLYTYHPSAAETAYDSINFTFVGSGAIPATVTVDTLTLSDLAALQAGSPPSATAVLTIITNALQGHNVYAPGEPVKPADATACLSQLNQILDDWNADGQTSVAGVFSTFVTTPSLQPHTIGPTGTWVLPVRPVRIDGAVRSLGNDIWTPIGVHDDPAWWLAQSLVPGALVTDLYYAPTVPNGSIFFKGVPTSALSIQILTRTVLAKVQLTQALDLAPGYESALTLTLQEAIADAFHATVSASLARRAAVARGRIFGNNLIVPSLSTSGLGLPGSDGAWWDYRSGTWRLR